MENNFNNSKAYDRLIKLFDENSFVELMSAVKDGDSKTAVITAYGTVNGKAVYAFSQDIENQSGAVGKGYYEKVNNLYTLAEKTGTPIVSIFDSFGAKLTETKDAVRAIGEINLKTNKLSGVVPQIALVLGTCAGSFATAAVSADLLVASKDASLFLNSPFLSEDADFDKADAIKEAGLAAIVSETEDDAITNVRNIIDMLPGNNLSAAPIFESVPSVEWDKFDSAADYAKILADASSEIELYESDSAKTYGALATVNGNVAMIIATAKEMGIADIQKIVKLVKLADAYSIPVVTLVDSEGFKEKGRDAELLKESAKLFSVLAETTSAKISVVTGNASGAVLVGFISKNASADMVYVLEDAVVSPVSASAGAIMMFGDKMKDYNDEKSGLEAIIAEYKANVASAENAIANGLADDIATKADLRFKVAAALDMLSAKRETRLPKKHSVI